MYVRFTCLISLLSDKVPGAESGNSTMHRVAALEFPGLVEAQLVTVNYLVFRNNDLFL
jgi:hypothetical protein